MTVAAKSKSFFPKIEFCEVCAMPDVCLLFFIKNKHSAPLIILVQTTKSWIKAEQKCKLSGPKGQTEVITSNALKDECTI